MAKFVHLVKSKAEPATVLVQFKLLKEDNEKLLRWMDNIPEFRPLTEAGKAVLAWVQAKIDELEERQ
jgi:hypothetical protein